MSEARTDLPKLPDPEIHHTHRDVSGGWLRPTVFGMMDGLVSNFALIAGVAGASASSSSVALAGGAGLVGGAFSMATGEYISVQSQNESTHAEVAVERHELKHNAAAELAELTQMYIGRGVEPDLAAKVAKQLSHDPEQALLIHAQAELGVNPAKLPSPWTAAFSSLASFSVGAFIPLLPYIAGATTLLVSAILAGVGLFTAGSITSRFTGRGWVFGGFRQLLLGAFAAAVTFGVGQLFHAAVG
jgi:VIT1/CCC1 family predicted Fe2+/Mn2+ transporter